MRCLPCHSEVLDSVEQLLNGEAGLDCAAPGFCHGSFARPRRFELAAAINRLRGLRVSSSPALPRGGAGHRAGAGAGAGMRHA